MDLGETKRVEVSLEETVREGPLRLELRFLEVPQEALKELKVIFDASVIREITLGRSPDNMVVIPDPTVSRRHAVITVLGPREALVRDLGSTNGTYVLEGNVFKRITEYRFSGEATLRLGFYTVIKLSLVQS